MVRISFLCILIFILANCSHAPLHSGPTAKERDLYEQGLKNLSKNDFDGANKKFSELLKKFPATLWLDGAFYNRGLALEGLKDYKGAANDYKRVTELDEGSSPSQTLSDAYYRLSMCYELLGDDAKMIIALKELEKDPTFLSKETRDLELPARLAAAYARQGNLDEAEVYFKGAALGIREFQSKFKDQELRAWLPKTLFNMGNTKPIKKNPSEEEFNTYLQGLEKTQSWLVRAIDAGPSEWSQKAADNISEIYSGLYAVIENTKGPEYKDKLMMAQKHQEIQRRMAAALCSTIEKLKLERLFPSPAEPEIPLLSTVFNTVLDVERRSSQILQAPDVQDQDTAEAKAHQGLKREGRIIESR